MKYFYNLTVILGLIVYFATGSLAQNNLTVKDSLHTKIKTAEEAVALAIEYLGFDELEGFEIKDPADSIALLTTAIDSLFPFISDSFNGNEVWDVEFNDISLFPGHDSIKRDISLQIDTESGLPLKATVAKKDYKKYEERYKSSPEEIKGHFRLDGSIFHGLPEEKPLVSFMQALDKSYGFAIRVNTISAYFVIHSAFMDSIPSLKWVLYLNGLPPIGKSFEAAEGNYCYSDQFYTVDATTGYRRPVAGFTIYEREIIKDK